MADTPAPQTPAKETMHLDQVPRFGDLVPMTPEQKAALEQGMKDPANKGKFVGQVMAQVGVSQTAIDQGLMHQSERKMEAAMADIASAIKGKSLEAKFTKPTWGNDGVNHAIEHPTRVDAASGVANMLQNLALLVKDHPQAAADPAVAKPLGEGFVNAIALKYHLEHSREPVDAAKTAQALGDALKEMVKATGEQPKDAKGHAVSVDEYVAARSSEITHGAALPMEKTKQLAEADKDKGLDQILAEGFSLHRFDHGKAVKELQQKLHIKDDGDFGPETAKAVAKLQDQAVRSGNILGSSGVHHDGVDGDFGKESAEYLNKLTPPTTPAQPKAAAAPAPAK